MFRSRRLRTTLSSCRIALVGSAVSFLYTHAALAQNASPSATAAAPGGNSAPASSPGGAPRSTAATPPRPDTPPPAPKRLEGPRPAESAPPPLPPPSDSAGPSGVPGSAPPPYMYQEPWTPPAGEQVPGARARRDVDGAHARREGADEVYGGPYLPGGYPPPYTYQAAPYAPLRHRTPWNALWVGGRIGAIFPYGNAWEYPGNGYGYGSGESWRGLATGGWSLEGNLGVRLARHYILYAFWEHGWLGQGSDPSWRTADGQGFGDQTSATTDFAGGGFRWSSRPDSVGVVLDVALGQRWFRERWSNAMGTTKLNLDGFGEFRVGIGAEIRVSPIFALSPMLSFSGGSFTNREITFPGAAAQPVTSTEGTHGTLTLTLGGHFDFGS